MWFAQKYVICAYLVIHHLTRTSHTHIQASPHTNVWIICANSSTHLYAPHVYEWAPYSYSTTHFDVTHTFMHHTRVWVSRLRELVHVFIQTIHIWVSYTFMQHHAHMSEPHIHTHHTNMNMWLTHMVYVADQPHIHSSPHSCKWVTYTNLSTYSYTTTHIRLSHIFIHTTHIWVSHLFIRQATYSWICEVDNHTHMS